MKVAAAWEGEVVVAAVLLSVRVLLDAIASAWEAYCCCCHWLLMVRDLLILMVRDSTCSMKIGIDWHCSAKKDVKELFGRRRLDLLE